MRDASDTSSSSERDDGPAPPADASPPPGRRDSSAPGGVLIALCDAPERARTADALRPHLHVELASDGLDAITRACTDPPAVLLIDPAFPDGGSSGYAVIRALRAAGSLIPVLVALPPRARAVDRIRPLIVGATDAIARPLDGHELERRIRSMLELGRGEPAPDLAEAELVFLSGTDSQVLSPARFLEHCGRALRVGRRFDFDSAVVALEAESSEALDVLIQAIDGALRVEDAFCVVPETRGVLLLVGSGRRQARTVLERLHRAVPSSCIGFRAHSVESLDASVQADLEPDWDVLFGGKEGDPAHTTGEFEWLRGGRATGLRERFRRLRRA